MKNFNILRRAKGLHRRWLKLEAKTVNAYDELRAVRNGAASFRRMMKESERRESLCGRKLVWKVNPKSDGLKFAKAVGVPAPSPESFQDVDSVIARVRESKSPLLLKPQFGHSSRGIYIIYAPDDIFDLQRREKVRNLEGFAQRIAGSDMQGWTMEPFLSSAHDARCPAHDLKFYCFYGRVGLVVELQRLPKTYYCWWNADGENIGKGKRNQPLFLGDGFSERDREWAVQLSKEIPVPFIRIDFLRSSQGTFFGEFTPSPGGFESFPNKLDGFLGGLYLEAEARLFDDLWNGKQFEIFRRSLGLSPGGAIATLP